MLGICLVKNKTIIGLKYTGAVKMIGYSDVKNKTIIGLKSV